MIKMVDNYLDPLIVSNPNINLNSNNELNSPIDELLSSEDGSLVHHSSDINNNHSQIRLESVSSTNTSTATFTNHHDDSHIDFIQNNTVPCSTSSSSLCTVTDNHLLSDMTSSVDSSNIKKDSVTPSNSISNNNNNNNFSQLIHHNLPNIVAVERGTRIQYQVEDPLYQQLSQTFQSCFNNPVLDLLIVVINCDSQIVCYHQGYFSGTPQLNKDLIKLTGKRWNSLISNNDASAWDIHYNMVKDNCKFTGKQEKSKIKFESGPVIRCKLRNIPVALHNSTLSSTTSYSLNQTNNQSNNTNVSSNSSNSSSVSTSCSTSYYFVQPCSFILNSISSSSSSSVNQSQFFVSFINIARECETEFALKGSAAASLQKVITNPTKLQQIVPPQPLVHHNKQQQQLHPIAPPPYNRYKSQPHPTTMHIQPQIVDYYYGANRVHSQHQQQTLPPQYFRMNSATATTVNNSANSSSLQYMLQEHAANNNNVASGAKLFKSSANYNNGLSTATTTTTIRLPTQSNTEYYTAAYPQYYNCAAPSTTQTIATSGIPQPQQQQQLLTLVMAPQSHHQFTQQHNRIHNSLQQIPQLRHHTSQPQQMHSTNPHTILYTTNTTNNNNTSQSTNHNSAVINKRLVSPEDNQSYWLTSSNNKNSNNNDNNLMDTGVNQQQMQYTQQTQHRQMDNNQNHQQHYHNHNHSQQQQHQQQQLLPSTTSFADNSIPYDIVEEILQAEEAKTEQNIYLNSDNFLDDNTNKNNNHVDDFQFNLDDFINLSVPSTTPDFTSCDSAIPISSNQNNTTDENENNNTNIQRTLSLGISSLATIAPLSSQQKSNNRVKSSHRRQSHDEGSCGDKLDSPVNNVGLQQQQPLHQCTVLSNQQPKTKTLQQITLKNNNGTSAVKVPSNKNTIATNLKHEILSKLSSVQHAKIKEFVSQFRNCKINKQTMCQEIKNYLHKELGDAAFNEQVMEFVNHQNRMPHSNELSLSGVNYSHIIQSPEEGPGISPTEQAAQSTTQDTTESDDNFTLSQRNNAISTSLSRNLPKSQNFPPPPAYSNVTSTTSAIATTQNKSQQPQHNHTQQYPSVATSSSTSTSIGVLEKLLNEQDSHQHQQHNHNNIHQSKKINELPAKYRNQVSLDQIILNDDYQIFINYPNNEDPNNITPNSNASSSNKRSDKRNKSQPATPSSQQPTPIISQQQQSSTSSSASSSMGVLETLLNQKQNNTTPSSTNILRQKSSDNIISGMNKASGPPSNHSNTNTHQNIARHHSLDSANMEIQSNVEQLNSNSAVPVKKNSLLITLLNNNNPKSIDNCYSGSPSKRRRISSGISNASSNDGMSIKTPGSNTYVKKELMEGCSNIKPRNNLCSNGDIFDFKDADLPLQLQMNPYHQLHQQNTESRKRKYSDESPVQSGSYNTTQISTNTDQYHMKQESSGILTTLLDTTHTNATTNKSLSFIDDSLSMVDIKIDDLDDFDNLLEEDEDQEQEDVDQDDNQTNLANESNINRSNSTTQMIIQQQNPSQHSQHQQYPHQFMNSVVNYAEFVPPVYSEIGPVIKNSPLIPSSNKSSIIHVTDRNGIIRSAISGIGSINNNTQCNATSIQPSSNISPTSVVLVPSHLLTSQQHNTAVSTNHNYINANGSLSICSDSSNASSSGSSASNSLHPNNNNPNTANSVISGECLDIERQRLLRQQQLQKLSIGVRPTGDQHVNNPLSLDKFSKQMKEVGPNVTVEISKMNCTTLSASTTPPVPSTINSSSMTNNSSISTTTASTTTTLLKNDAMDSRNPHRIRSNSQHLMIQPNNNNYQLKQHMINTTISNGNPQQHNSSQPQVKRQQVKEGLRQLVSNRSQHQQQRPVGTPSNVHHQPHNVQSLSELVQMPNSPPPLATSASNNAMGAITKSSSQLSACSNDNKNCDLLEDSLINDVFELEEMVKSNSTKIEEKLHYSSAELSNESKTVPIPHHHHHHHHMVVQNNSSSNQTTTSTPTPANKNPPSTFSTATSRPPYNPPHYHHHHHHHHHFNSHQHNNIDAATTTSNHQDIFTNSSTNSNNSSIPRKTSNNGSSTNTNSGLLETLLSN